MFTHAVQSKISVPSPWASSAGNTGHGGHLKHLSHLSHGCFLWSPQLLNYLLTLLPSTCATFWQSKREAVKQSLLTRGAQHPCGTQTDKACLHSGCHNRIQTGGLFQRWTWCRWKASRWGHHRTAPTYRKSSWHPQSHLDSILHPRSDIWTSITTLFFGLWSKSSKNTDNCCGTVIIWWSAWSFRWHKYLGTHSQRDRGDTTVQYLTSRHTAPHKIHPAAGQDFATWS